MRYSLKIPHASVVVHFLYPRRLRRWTLAAPRKDVSVCLHVCVCLKISVSFFHNLLLLMMLRTSGLWLLAAVSPYLAILTCDIARSFVGSRFRPQPLLLRWQLNIVYSSLVLPLLLSLISIGSAGIPGSQQNNILWASLSAFCRFSTCPCCLPLIAFSRLSQSTWPTLSSAKLPESFLLRSSWTYSCFSPPL